jgi:methenyltetrahydrofolate cyclohydrolase
MNVMKEKTIESFLDELASKHATPGGGSAAALIGAQAAALVSMVCNLTLGKPKYAAVQDEMNAILTEAEDLRTQLTTMIKDDIEVFDRLMDSYALPKTSDAEKALRTAQIQTVLKQATLVPLACVKACVKVIKLSRIAAEKGSLGAISDAGVATMAAYSALKGAALNVHINTSGLHDQEFAKEKMAELASLMQGIETETLAIYDFVNSKL